PRPATHRAAGRPRHAARPGPRLRRLRALRRLARTRSRWLPRDSRRPERASALALLPRGVPAVGARRAAVVPARCDRTYTDADAELRRLLRLRHIARRFS